MYLFIILKVYIFGLSDEGYNYKNTILVYV